MISIDALFKVSYGLYIVSSGSGEKGNGFISNTFFQVSSSPAKFAACCSKENFSAELIRQTGSFGVSVLKQDAGAGLIGTFGYKSGKDVNKLEGLNLKTGLSGVPLVLNDAIALLECRVVDIQDVGSHLMFIGELVQAEVLEEGVPPLTYAHYREVKKGLAPKNAPTYVDKSALESQDAVEEKAPEVAEATGTDQWQCSACGFIFDEEKEGRAFSDLPDDWTCPVCGMEKEDFFIL